jgi:hypothetical protein
LLTEPAAAENINLFHIRRALRLTLLAPDLVEAILNGLRPPELQLAALGPREQGAKLKVSGFGRLDYTLAKVARVGKSTLTRILAVVDRTPATPGEPKSYRPTSSGTTPPGQ